MCANFFDRQHASLFGILLDLSCAPSPVFLRGILKFCIDIERLGGREGKREMIVHSLDKLLSL